MKPTFAACVFALALSACITPAKPRLGMVVDAQSGLMFGSAISGSLVTDPTFYADKTLKVRTRNTSGDVAFDLNAFKLDLENAYTAKGYAPIPGDENFGLMMDINVMYSGQVQTNQAAQFGLIGGILGAANPTENPRKHIGATVSGAALGHIIGSFATDDTYMIVARVTFGVVKRKVVTKKRVTFSRSQKIVDLDEPSAQEKVYTRGFKKTFTTEFTVYAGGRNVSQADIAAQVKERAVRIAADFI